MILPIFAMAVTLVAASDATSPQVTAPAKAAPASVATASSKPAKDPNRIVCRTEEVTGSRFTQRICQTQAQWDNSEEAAQNYKRSIDDRNGLQGAQSSPF